MINPQYDEERHRNTQSWVLQNQPAHEEPYPNNASSWEYNNNQQPIKNWQDNGDGQPMKQWENNELTNDFYCSMCDHQSANFDDYQRHVICPEHVARYAEQNKHIDQEWIAPNKKKGDFRVCDVKSIQDEFINYPKPLIGLKHVSGAIDTNREATFQCSLCNTEMSARTKFNHLTGVKHRYRVIKELDVDEAISIKANHPKRSELTRRLAQEAAKIERKEDRRKVPIRDERDERKSDKRKVFTSLETPQSPPPEDRGSLPPTEEEEEGWIPSPSDPPDETDPIRGHFNKERKKSSPYSEYLKTLQTAPPSRGRSAQSSPRSSRESSPSSSDKSPPRPSPSKSPPGSSARRSYRSKSPIRSSSRGQSPRKRKPSPPARHTRIQTRRSTSPRDISDEIRAEMERVRRREREKVREEERRVREKKERRMQKKRKRREEKEAKRTKKNREENEDVPPPPPRKIEDEMDEATKRLVLQNLTKLAQCCVTNEADAELALQVSNALTQALLQYRMKHMPQAVIQSLNTALTQQQQEQQRRQQQQQQQQQLLVQQQQLQQLQQQMQIIHNNPQQPFHQELAAPPPPPQINAPPINAPPAQQMNAPPSAQHTLPPPQMLPPQQQRLLPPLPPRPPQIPPPLMNNDPPYFNQQQGFNRSFDERPPFNPPPPPRPPHHQPRDFRNSPPQQQIPSRGFDNELFGPPPKERYNDPGSPRYSREDRQWHPDRCDR